jgi:predicted component of type VI protein secretion system
MGKKAIIYFFAGLLLILILILILSNFLPNEWPKVASFPFMENYSVQKSTDNKSRLVTFNVATNPAYFSLNYSNSLEKMGWRQRIIGPNGGGVFEYPRGVRILGSTFFQTECPAFYLSSEITELSQNYIEVKLKQELGPCGWTPT